MRLTNIITEQQVADNKYQFLIEEASSTFWESCTTMYNLPLSESAHNDYTKRIEQNLMHTAMMLPISYHEKLEENILNTAANSLNRFTKKAMDVTGITALKKWGGEIAKKILGWVTSTSKAYLIAAGLMKDKLEKTASNLCPAAGKIKENDDGSLTYNGQILLEYKLDSTGEDALHRLVNAGPTVGEEGDKNYKPAAKFDSGTDNAAIAVNKALDYASTTEAHIQLAQAIVAIKYSLKNGNETTINGLNVREITKKLYSMNDKFKASSDKVSGESGRFVGTTSADDFALWVDSDEFPEYVNSKVRGEVKTLAATKDLGLKDDGDADTSSCEAGPTVEAFEKAFGSPEMTDFVSKMKLPIKDISEPVMSTIKNSKSAFAGAGIALALKFWLGTTIAPFITVVAITILIPLAFKLGAEYGKQADPVWKDSTIATLETLAKWIKRAFYIIMPITAIVDAFLDPANIEEVVPLTAQQLTDQIDMDSSGEAIPAEDVVKELNKVDLGTLKTTLDGINEFNVLDVPEAEAIQSKLFKVIQDDKKFTQAGFEKFVATADAATKAEFIAGMEKTPPTFTKNVLDVMYGNDTVDKAGVVAAELLVKAKASIVETGLSKESIAKLTDTQITKLSTMMTDKTLTVEEFNKLVSDKTLILSNEDFNPLANKAGLELKDDKWVAIDKGGSDSFSKEDKIPAIKSSVIEATKDQVDASKAEFATRKDSGELHELIKEFAHRDGEDVIPGMESAKELTELFSKKGFTLAQTEAFLSSIDPDDLKDEDTVETLMNLAFSTTDKGVVNTELLKKISENGHLGTLKSAMTNGMNSDQLNALFTKVAGEVDPANITQDSPDIMPNLTKLLETDTTDGILKFMAQVKDPTKYADIIAMVESDPTKFIEMIQSSPTIDDALSLEKVLDTININDFDKYNANALSSVIKVIQIDDFNKSGIKVEDLLNKMNGLEDGGAVKFQRAMSTFTADDFKLFMDAEPKVLARIIAPDSSITTAEDMVAEFKASLDTKDQIEKFTVNTNDITALEKDFSDSEKALFKTELTKKLTELGDKVGHSNIKNIDFDAIVKTSVDAALEAKKAGGFFSLDNNSIKNSMDAVIASVTDGSAIKAKFLTTEGIKILTDEIDVVVKTTDIVAKHSDVFNTPVTDWKASMKLYNTAVDLMDTDVSTLEKFVAKIKSTGLNGVNVDVKGGLGEVLSDQEIERTGMLSIMKEIEGSSSKDDAYSKLTKALLEDKNLDETQKKLFDNLVASLKPIYNDDTLNTSLKGLFTASNVTEAQGETIMSSIDEKTMTALDDIKKKAIVKVFLATDATSAQITDMANQLNKGTLSSEFLDDITTNEDLTDTLADPDEVETLKNVDTKEVPGFKTPITAIEQLEDYGMDTGFRKDMLAEFAKVDPAMDVKNQLEFINAIKPEHLSKLMVSMDTLAQQFADGLLTTSDLAIMTPHANAGLLENILNQNDLIELDKPSMMALFDNDIELSKVISTDPETMQRFMATLKLTELKPEGITSVVKAFNQMNFKTPFESLVSANEAAVKAGKEGAGLDDVMKFLGSPTSEDEMARQRIELYINSILNNNDAEYAEMLGREVKHANGDKTSFLSPKALEKAVV